MSGLYRLLRNGAALKFAILQAAADFYSRSRKHNLTLTERAEWLHTWSAKCLERMGIQVFVTGTPPIKGLIVSNHLSYLDILVYGSAMPCVFVSKTEVRRWPVFGTMANLAGTVYVDRKLRTDTRNANAGILNALEQGVRVVVFPEGTSSDGSQVLPFYASLLEPAVASGAPVTAAYLNYEVQEGAVGKHIAYWGDMTFFPHLMKLLSLREVSAAVRFAERSRTFKDRKTAALEMREEVLKLKT